jgi:transcriptional regulator with XRE-family HTH domain
MAKRRHFLKQWRKHRGLSQVQLAERLHINQGQLSKIENFKKPWDEDLLAAAAEELRCEPVDILIRDPTGPDAIWSIWQTLKPVEQAQAVEVIKALRRTGTD